MSEKDQNPTPSLFKRLTDNTIHVLPTLFYTGLGIAVKTPLPVIGSVHWLIPAGLCAGNVVSRFEETNILVSDQDARSHHRPEILANYMVNLGLLAAATWQRLLLHNLLCR